MSAPFLYDEREFVMEFKSYYLDSPLVKGRIFDVFVPENVTKDIAVFFVHGGGWRGGGRDFHEIMQALNQRGHIAASTDYRLDAKDAFEQLKDIRESYDKFVSVLKELERPLKIAVYGVSAGAHLASLLLCAAPGECGENAILENGWIKPCKGILQATPYDFHPWDNIQPAMWSVMQDIAGASYEDNKEPFERLSLKNYIREDNPPLFFMEAEYEHLFPSELTKKIADKHSEFKIKSQWKVYPGVEHGFFYELKRPSQLAAFEDFCKFIERE
ncbi:MAG: alpha/beta hydrolase fold domain-containing protein [Oscillospiraceae bacterium]|nr:alpha/beta hydrolase fold domain-containing protein [Oscillospiraceae bacterium]